MSLPLVKLNSICMIGFVVEHCCCRRYRYLWSNGPKECLEFADYTFEEHFGKPIPSYPPRAVLFDYIKGRVIKADVIKWCRFNTVVRTCTFDNATQQFTIVSRNLKEGTEATEMFDNVICATGHFSTPNVPEFTGFETFEGRVLHAHDFRDACEFTVQCLCPTLRCVYSPHLLVYGEGFSSQLCSSMQTP